MTVLLCPLCSQPRFTNLESLRLSLINAATQSISCPICNEVLMGLDKLTIHLFGHTLNQNRSCLELKTTKPEVFSESNENYPEPEVGLSKITEGPVETNVISREEFNKPEETTIKVDSFPLTELEEKESASCTVNMEDLSFLTSWENSFRSHENSKDSETNSLSPEVSCFPENEETALEEKNEDNVELSEYMSELLTKKLPVLNFVFTMDVPEKTEPEKPEAVEETKSYKCLTCGCIFENSSSLSTHQEVAHSKRGREEDEKSKSEDVTNLSPTQKIKTVGGRNVNDVLSAFVLPQYDCHLCSKSFKMKGSLLVHYRVAHLGVNTIEGLPTLGGQNGNEERNFHCSICSKSFKKEQHLTQHIKTHEGKQWQCETCNKHFTTKYFLKKHQRLHTGEMPYSCQTCNKTFTFQQSYHKHLLYHSDEKPHQCSQCGRSFKELSTLQNHLRIHSGEKPFGCETCGKCFRQRVSYIVHQRIHTGVLPYQCTACKKKFRYKVSQRSHKCTAQPPGIVMRQSTDLIQRILEHRNNDGILTTQTKEKQT